MVNKVDREVEEKDNQMVENDKEVNNQKTTKKDKKTSKARIDTKSKTSKSKQTKGQASAKKEVKDTTKNKIEELSSKLVAEEEKSREWHDKYMRLSAEFDNYRKRTLKEKAELTKLANANLLKDILPVIDDFERGKDNIDKADDIEALKEGINHIYNKFVEFIGQNGVKEIESKEKVFDIDFHEALTKVPAPEEGLKGKVIDVIEKGYLLNDKVLRYAKVVVGE